MFERIVQDLRYGLRVLISNPIFSLAALIALALGIGANSVILSAVNAVLLRPLPYENAERLVRLFSDERGLRNGVSRADLRDCEERTRVFQGVAAFRQKVLTLTGQREPLQVQAAAVGPGLFALLGSEAVLGHTRLRPGESDSEITAAVVSHRFWQVHLGGRRDAVGETLTLNGQAAVLLGVMEPDFWFPSRETELWYALPAPSPQQAAQRGRRDYGAVARLKQGVDLEEARGELNAVAADLAERFPATNQGVGITGVLLREQLVGDSKGPLLILSIAVALVLLITCANVANLLLARAAARRREIGIRTALGAGRTRLLRQLLTESLLLAVLGGLLALPVAHWSLRFLSSSVPAGLADSMPGIQHLRIDLQAFLYTLALACLTGIAFGLLPALRTSRCDFSEALRPSSGDSSDGRGGGRLSRTLVVLETALVLTLLITSSLAIRSFLRIQQVDPGFQAEQILTMQLEIPAFKHPLPQQAVHYYQRVEEEVAALPQVEAAALTSRLPLGGGGQAVRITRRGQSEETARSYPPAALLRVGSDYFRVMGIPIVEGRSFRGQGEADPVAILNQAAVERFWSQENPIGSLIRLDGEENFRRVIGVARNIRNSGLVWPAHPEVYVPYQQKPSRNLYLAAHTGQDPYGQVEAVRARIWSVDGEQPITRVRSTQAYLADWSAPRRLFAFLLGVFSVISLVLALVGIYGLVAYSVHRQKRQIGIRMALGAKPSLIWRTTIKKSLVMLIMGTVLGLAGAWGFGKVLSGALFLYGVSATDVVSFTLFPVLLILAGLAAAGIPAYRASRIDPSAALRED